MTSRRQEKDMGKRSMEFLFGAACYFGVAGGLCAISFLGEFAVPVRVDASLWPLMHVSVVEVIVPPADSAAVKE